MRALVRTTADADKLQTLQKIGAAITTVDFSNLSTLSTAMQGASCVISALSGLREVIIDTQTHLLEAAVEANVPRFISSDFSIDYTKLPDGSNRNLDLRREFSKIADQVSATKPISVTTTFNGAFMDMLTGQAPIILFKFKRVLFWGDADQKMDFTTIDNTASFTASAALDANTPRHLHIAGDLVSARDLADTVSQITLNRYRLMRAGSLSNLATFIKIARFIAPKTSELYPPWQGMQYLHDMFGGSALPGDLDNDRYTDIGWTNVRQFLIQSRSVGSPPFTAL